MARILLLLLAACVVPAIVTARFVSESFHVQGSVYCDTCRCGYETDATEYMAGATVRIECRSKDSDKITYSTEAVTDHSGRYAVDVATDCGDDVCDAILVKSANPECATPNAGRDRARVILTRNNGMTSNIRYANNMGFLKKTALPNCAQILQKYQETEEF
ncbi:major pollen allergen Lol p 11-like [Salvia miltiorrhiza]|uniref:major pollen allergen Lol p 11-like n=1 Tax=Salvia miltiorrhiza TaxID=226208 RepID=UPI0025AD53A6|nr:major pollen allergen Lol p 11-like [Salvia miltiorrhiza]XP_057786048.1 major pollen allergen Lol p 11-like [Salvia miltiorrhiza]